MLLRQASDSIGLLIFLITHFWLRVNYSSLQL
jgi:hypothetical protein